MNKLFLSIVALVAFTFSSFAQRQADYIEKFNNKIEAILLNKLNGHVLIKESDKITDFNSEKNQAEWVVSEKELGAMSALNVAKKLNAALNDPDLLKIFESSDQLAFIDNSPFIKGTINGKDVIVNASNGQIVFNSELKDYRVLLSQFLPDEKQFLFFGVEGKEFKIILYDLASGSEKWVTTVGTKDGMLKSLSSMFSRNVQTRKDQVLASGNAIYASINNKLYKLDQESGKLYWSPDYDVSRFYVSQGGNYVIIIKNNGGVMSFKKNLNVLESQTGKPIWKDDITTRFISYIEDWGDRFLLAHSSGFNFYDYKTGEKIWKKNAKGDDIKQVIAIGDDYLYVADNEMSLIDKDGKQKWKNFIEISDDKTDPVYYLNKIDNNRVFYLTATYGNMVDYTTGKKIWRGNIKFEKERPLLYVQDDRTKSFLVYNDEKIYKFDPNATDKPEAFSKLKVKNEKMLSGIELFDWGVSLTGENEVIGVNLDGSTKYQRIYKEPGEAGRRLLKTGAMIGSGYLGLRAGLKEGLANIETSVVYKNDKGETVTQNSHLLTEDSRNQLLESAESDKQIASFIDNTVLKRVKERFKALKQNSDYAFIFARGDVGETNYLVKVRKADGEEIDKIAIDNKKPIYEVDPINNNIYYVYNNELRVFTKK